MEMINRYRRFMLFFLCAGYLFLSGCRKSFDPASADYKEESTLESLRCVDDYPVYTMTYRGDYGFRRYLETGSFQSSRVLKISTGWGCSCFGALSADGNRIFGRNFDWYDRATLILFTHAPDAYASVSIVNPVFLGYSSKPDFDSMENRKDLLGSPYFPLDGLNEKGVAVGLMAVPSAQPPFDPAKIKIGELQVIRLVLDYASDTEEAVRLIGQYNVVMTDPPVHYLIADRGGRSAAVEFVNGKMQVFRNTDAWQACTNFILTGSAAMQDYRKADCRRYKTMYGELINRNGNVTSEQGMQLLSSVSQQGTMWSAVYDMSGGKVQFVPGRKYEKTFSFTVKGE